MKIAANNVADYIDSLPEDRRDAMNKLRTIINKNLPKGFTEQLSYGMPGWVVSHKDFPAGYHCDPKLPLPFMSIASQKNFIALYHMGIYADESLLQWFQTAYPKHCKTKLDMGKSCIRFKKPELIPFDLIGELCKKMTQKQWVELYSKNLKQ